MKNLLFLALLHSATIGAAQTQPIIEQVCYSSSIDSNKSLVITLLDLNDQRFAVNYKLYSSDMSNPTILTDTVETAPRFHGVAKGYPTSVILHSTPRDTSAVYSIKSIKWANNYKCETTSVEIRKLKGSSFLSGTPDSPVIAGCERLNDQWFKLSLYDVGPKGALTIRSTSQYKAVDSENEIEKIVVNEKIVALLSQQRLSIIDGTGKLLYNHNRPKLYDLFATSDSSISYLNYSDTSGLSEISLTVKNDKITKCLQVVDGKLREPLNGKFMTVGNKRHVLVYVDKGTSGLMPILYENTQDTAYKRSTYDIENLPGFITSIVEVNGQFAVVCSEVFQWTGNNLLDSSVRIGVIVQSLSTEGSAPSRNTNDSEGMNVDVSRYPPIPDGRYISINMDKTYENIVLYNLNGQRVYKCENCKPHKLFRLRDCPLIPGNVYILTTSINGVYTHSKFVILPD